MTAYLKHAVTVMKATRKIIVMTVLLSTLAFSVAWGSEKVALSIAKSGSFKDLAISVILENDPRATLFTNALKSSNLWQAVTKTDRATIFVPTDAALQTEGSAFLLEVVLLKSENSERLNSLMAQHLVPNETIEFGELIQSTNYVNESGGCLLVAPIMGAVKIGPEAFVTDATVARNGNIYFIDRLLWQPYQEPVNC